MAKKRRKTVEHRYYTYSKCGKPVHYKDGTPRIVDEQFVKNNSCTFDQNEFFFHHREWTEE